MIGWRSFLSHFSWVYVGWRSQGFLNQQLWTIKQGMSVSICDVKSLKFFEGSVTSDQWSVVNFCSMELIYCYNADIHDNNFFSTVLISGADFKELWCHLCGRNNRRNCLSCLPPCDSLWTTGMWHVKGTNGDTFSKVNFYFTIQVSEEMSCLHAELTVIGIICPFTISVHHHPHD